MVIPAQINEHVVLSRLLALAHPLEHFFPGDAAGGVAGCWEGGVPGLFCGWLGRHDVCVTLSDGVWISGDDLLYWKEERMTKHGTAQGNLNDSKRHGIDYEGHQPISVRELHSSTSLLTF